MFNRAISSSTGTALDPSSSSSSSSSSPPPPLPLPTTSQVKAENNSKTTASPFRNLTHFNQSAFIHSMEPSFCLPGSGQQRTGLTHENLSIQGVNSSSPGSPHQFFDYHRLNQNPFDRHHVTQLTSTMNVNVSMNFNGSSAPLTAAAAAAAAAAAVASSSSAVGANPASYYHHHHHHQIHYPNQQVYVPNEQDIHPPTGQFSLNGVQLNNGPLSSSSSFSSSSSSSSSPPPPAAPQPPQQCQQNQTGSSPTTPTAVVAALYHSAAAAAAAASSNSSYSSYSNPHLHPSMFSLPNVPYQQQYQAATTPAAFSSTLNNHQPDYSLAVNYKDSKFFANEFLNDYEKKYKF